MIFVHIWDWFLTFSGSNNTSGVQYGFWSGFGSDIGEVVIIGGVVSIFRQHNCHVKGCYRFGKHEVEGTPYKTCKIHHPDMGSGDITHEAIIMAHRAHKEATAPISTPQTVKLRIKQ